MKWHNFLIFSTDSFIIGTCTRLQFPGIFKLSRILFTTARFSHSSDQYFFVTSTSWLDMAGPNSSSLIFPLFISSNIPKPFPALFSFPDWSCFSESGTSRLMFLSNISFDALQISTFIAFLLDFFWGGEPQLLS